MNKWKIRKPKRINKAYEKFIRTKHCCVCGQTPVDLHHVRHNRSDSFVSTPLCRYHHTYSDDSYHRLGHERFEELHGLDMDEVMSELKIDYIEYLEGLK